MSEITTTSETSVSSKFGFAWLAFFVLVIFVYFFGLSIPLLGPDEPRYAQVAREMMERGDWVTPTLGGFNWFEKPSLFYWLEIFSYKIFGVSEFAARFGSALFGIGTIISLWILGNTASADRSKAKDQRSKNLHANWLALIAATTLGIIGFSRGASFDIIITFPITAALVSFYKWHSDNDRESKVTNKTQPYFSPQLFFFYFFVGVALLAKGLIGIVFPFGIVAVYYMLLRRLPASAFLVSLFWGTLLSLIVAATWYLPMYLAHGPTFIDEFIVQQHFQRFVSNKYQHPQPFYFFFWVLPLLTLPWLPFFIAAIWNLIRVLFLPATSPVGPHVESPHHHADASRIRLFAASWLLVPLLFFSFSGSKLPGYILPAVPAAIILAWLFLVPRLERSRTWRKATALIGVSTLVMVTALLMWVVPRYAVSDSVKGLVASANAAGHSNEKVLCLNTLSHNAEFYAAGRLVRDEAGRQRRFYAPAEIRAEIEAENGKPVLVLVPLEHVSLLTRNEALNSLILSENGELAIVEVALK